VYCIVYFFCWQCWNYQSRFQTAESCLSTVGAISFRPAFCTGFAGLCRKSFLTVWRSDIWQKESFVQSTGKRSLWKNEAKILCVEVWRSVNFILSFSTVCSICFIRCPLFWFDCWGLHRPMLSFDFFVYHKWLCLEGNKDDVLRFQLTLYMLTETRKPCCRKETARCRSCSFSV